MARYDWLWKLERGLYAVGVLGAMPVGFLAANYFLSDVPGLVRYPVAAGAGVVALLLVIPVFAIVEDGFDAVRQQFGIQRHMGDTDYSDVIDDYKRTGELPLLWQWTARELVVAANHLRRRREQVSDDAVSNDASLFTSAQPMLLLYGLALENLLKGLLVAQGVDATATGRLNARLKTHDLLVLWKAAGLKVTADAEDVLRNLHWSIEPGKYPVGTKPDPNAPNPMFVALTSIEEIGRLLAVAEEALRARQRRQVLSEVDLLSL